jgi:hypothetical protein
MHALEQDLAPSLVSATTSKLKDQMKMWYPLALDL